MSDGDLQTFELRAASAEQRSYEVLKFRERLNELESPSAAVKLERRGGERVRASEEKFAMAAGGRRYEGTHESVGASSQAASCYVAMRVQGGVLTMMPLGDWFSFRPAVTHNTIGLDDAEALMAKTDKQSVLRDSRVAKLRKRSEGEDEDEGSEGRGARGAAGGGGGGGDDDFDEFDDGAGPAWAAGEVHEEDGNEGLDMQDEELFEDDEDDSFEAAKARDLQYGCVSTDDAELAFHDVFDEKRNVEEERQRKQLEDALAADGAQVDSVLEAAEEAEEGGRSAEGEWETQTNEVLKADRNRRRREEEWDEDEEDEEAYDEHEDVQESLRKRVLAAPEPVDASREPVESGGRKRGPPPEGAAPKADRSKMAKIREGAAARGGGSAAVQEKDLVLLLHRRGQMSLKELIGHFKTFISSSEEHQAFIQMMARVAFISEEGGAKVAKLKDSILISYGLE